ncbi:MAG: hypothetical protein A3K19_22135 [Lentisphaerae bacterium RIFOXYB12_FULL_65_16]|nr:MAG: hypothetical protein A3K18_21435 [Lentisphaerae bacterium RIFOXYA12_64_32]OGV93561.1 MAG: hypothetical protein A3K19_22135 [Lentisphaerae bacterium RIFOXYB12_FULL_65_16]
MPVIVRNSQFVPENSRDVAYEDFDLRCSLRVPAGGCMPPGQFFLISMRVKTPLVAAPEENYINPQTNMGGKQYFLAFSSDGGTRLQKTERRDTEPFWREVVNDDGKKLDVPHAAPYILAEVKDAFSGDRLNVEVCARGGQFRVTVNGRPIIDVTDDCYYPKGYINFSASGCDLELLEAEIQPASRVQMEIVDVTPTRLFVKGEPLRQLAKVQVDNRSGTAVPCFAKTILAGREAVETIGPINPGRQEVDVLVPDVLEPTRLRLELFAEGSDHPAVAIEQDWQPQRKRTMWLFTSSHEDLGYCGYINKLKEEMAQYLDVARKLCDATADLAPGHRYQYLIEHMWWLLGYADLRSPAQMRELVEKYVRTGRLEPMFIHSGTHTHWNQYEQLARSTYYGRREARDRFGINPVTAIYGDTPGITWPAAQVFAKAGARYLLNARGPWRYERKSGAPDQFYADPENTFPYYECDPSGVVGPFFWEGPNGKDRLLTQSIWSYGGDRIFHFTMHKGYHDFVKYIVKYLAFKQDYPWDDMLEPCYTDHEIPNISIVDLVSRWNAKFAYPQLRLCNLTEYFQHMEQHYADRLPVRRGELPSNWADYATIDPESFGRKRALANELPFLEFLACLVRSFDPGTAYPYAEVYDILWRLMEFDEHCWATMLPPSQDNVFNNDITKKGNIAWARQRADALRARLLAAVNRHVPGGGPCRILVWNPLAHARDDVVQASTEGFPFPNFRLVDSASGESLACQFITGKEIMFEVRNVPACGCRVIRVEPDDAPREQRPLQDGVTHFASEHYDVTLRDGAITGIYDKHLQRQLIDPDAPYTFNQFLYVHTEHYTSPDTTVRVPVIDRLTVESGPVATILRIYGTETESGARLEQTLVFYRHSKRIDVTNRQYEVRKLLYEGCLGKYYGDIGNRYLDNFFYAFPFKVEDFRFSVELAGGVAAVPDDYLPVGVRDFFTCQNWVDVGNDDFGVALYTREAPILHLGEIRYNRFDRNYVPERPHLYSFAVSNRMAGLHTRSLEDCDLTFHYSIHPHARDWRTAGVPQWSWQQMCPLVAVVENRESTEPPAGTVLAAANSGWVDIGNPGVQLSAFKHTEKPGGGYVLRLIETSGRPCTTQVRIPFLDTDRAWLASVAEDPQQELAVASAHNFDVELLPFDMVTVILRAKGAPLGRAANLRATQIKDNNLTLTWDREGNADGWYVFRGVERDFAPLQYNLVGYTGTNAIQDHGLDLGTLYYYRVMAVDRWNNGGDTNEVLAVTTSTTNVSPPAALSEIRVTVIDQETLALTWKTSREKDVAFYEVYRAAATDGSDRVLVDRVDAEPFYIQFYRDRSLRRDTWYYYSILAVDTAGNRAGESMTAARKTPAGDWWLERSYAHKYRR